MTATDVPESAPDSISTRTNCDRCPAQARHTARLELMSLHLCKHHSDKFKDALTEQGWTVTEIV